MSITRMVRRAAGALALCSPLIMDGCHRDADSLPPRNVILITVDTMRADRLSCYGYRASATPNMDRLAAEGARFALAYSDIPWTTGSLASTMTGTFGPRHGVHTTTNKLPDDRTTLAEILQARGFGTGAVLASFATDSAYNLDQGFDSYDDDLNTPVFRSPGQPVSKVNMEGPDSTLTRAEVDSKIANDGYRSDVDVTDSALGWLEAHREQRFFLWVHYFGPHERFVLTPGTDHRTRVVTDYDRDTRATDWSLGRLLDRLDEWGLTKETLVILHSDHGQAMREHGIFGHGHDIYDESVRIPILMRLPGRIESGTTVNALARNVDILPTVLGYLGIEAPSGLDGRSLQPLIEGRQLPDVPAYLELVDATPLPVEMIPTGAFFAGSNWHGVRLGSWKYLNVSLNPPCILNPAGYGPFAFLDVNPLHPVGGRPLPEAECRKPLRQNLFLAQGTSYADEKIDSNKVGEEKDVALELKALVDSIQESTTGSETFRLDPEQERKLRSLGYLR